MRTGPSLPIAGLAALGIALFLNATPAQAHALIGRSDEPIPGWLFGWAAAIVLIISFFALAIAWRRPRFEGDSWRPLRFSPAPGLKGLAGLAGVLLLCLVISAGFAGTTTADRNFAVPFVFATMWLGGVAVSVLFGDIMRAFNPWSAIAGAAASLWRRATGSAPRPLAPYPERLGRLPALLGLIAFGWIELVYSPTADGGIISPRDLALAVCLYSLYTLAAMALFGRHKWLDCGETFSVYFNMFSRLAPLEMRDGQLGQRRWLDGLPGYAEVPWTSALVVSVIGITTFDGAAEGVLSSGITETSEFLGSLSLGPILSDRLALTLFLLLTLAFVQLLFWAGLRGMRSAGGNQTTRQLARLFGHAFVPIALAYLVAHYFSYFIFQMQAQFTYLISDPLGRGWDIFGTASAGVDYDLLGSTVIWYAQLAALVAGHVASLAMAHDRALAIYRDIVSATRSQYWMLALMVGFTCLGLFLLSYSNQ